MKIIKQYFWIGLVVVFVAMDQISKYLVNLMIPVNGSTELIPGFFSLQHVRNDGAAMGILDGHRWIFMTFTVIIIVVAVFFLCSGKVKNHWGILSISMIIGGGIGNMIDRVLLGEVIDFFDLGCESVKRLEFKDFPLIVGIDSCGGNIFIR